MHDISPDAGGGPPCADDDAFVFAALGAFVILAVASMVALATPIAPPPARYDGTPLAMLADVAPWRRLHETVLLGTAVVSGVGLLVTRSKNLVTATAARLSAALLVLVLAVAVMAHSWIDPSSTSHTYSILFGEKYGLLTSLSPFTYRSAGIASCALALVLLWMRRIPDHWTIWALVVIYAAALELPGLLASFDLSRISAGALQAIQWHYDIFFGPKNDLVRGIEPEGFGYGIGLSLFAALVERAFGPFSFAGDIRLVQIGNLVFALVTLAGWYLWFRGRALVALLAALLVLPWIHSLHQGLFFPNQTGWRFIFIPIALAAFALGHRLRDTTAALIFGAVAGTAALWNPETGPPIVLGLASCLGARLPRLDIRSLAGAGSLFLLGAVAAIAAIGAIHLAALGRSLPVAALAADFVGRLSGYPFGSPLSFDPLALVVLISAIGAVLAGAWRRRTGPLAADAAGAFGSGVIILVWAAYYLQRSHPWNLWTFLLPFSIILGAAWSALLDAKSITSNVTRLAFSAAALAVAFVLGPAILAGNIQVVASLDRAASLQGPSPQSGELFGVMVPEPDRSALLDRLAALRSLPPGTLVVTGDSYLLPKPLGRRDLFVLPDPAFGRRHDGSPTDHELRAMVGDIHARSPTLILFEDETVAGSDDFHRGFFAALRAGVSDRYRLEATRSGWSWWRRIR